MIICKDCGRGYVTDYTFHSHRKVWGCSARENDKMSGNTQHLSTQYNFPACSNYGGSSGVCVGGLPGGLNTSEVKVKVEGYSGTMNHYQAFFGREYEVPSSELRYDPTEDYRETGARLADFERQERELFEILDIQYRDILVQLNTIKVELGMENAMIGIPSSRGAGARSSVGGLPGGLNTSEVKVKVEGYSGTMNQYQAFSGREYEVPSSELRYDPTEDFRVTGARVADLERQLSSRP